MSTRDVWTFSGDDWKGHDLTEYDVEALDGRIGTIDEATYEVSGSYVVVDTGPWIFGKKVLLPAGVIDQIDPAEKRVYVNRTKEEIKNAPEYDEAAASQEAYRTELGRYYGPGGAAYRDPARRSASGRQRF
jgi:hypothetical protein